ncbi:MAG: TolC family protein [Polyangiaceae bacterium]
MTGVPRAAWRHAAALAIASAVATLPHATIAAPTAAPVPAESVLSRTEALARLQRESFELLAARHRVSQARASVIAAGVWTNPNVSATFLFLTHGAVTGGNQELVVSVDQVIPIAGQVGLRKDVANAQLTAEERDYEDALWTLLANAKVAYLGLQRAEARATALKNGVADLAKVEAIVKERAAAGANSAYDRVRVGVERSKVEGRLAEAETDVVTARTELAQAIGASVDSLRVRAEPALPDVDSAPEDVDALVARAIAQRPDLARARARANASDLKVGLLRRQVVPSPDVSVGYARYFDVPGAAKSTGGAVIVGLSLPVPILDRGQGTVDRGVAEAGEDRVNAKAVEVAVKRDVLEATARMRIRVDAWKRFRETTAKDIDRLRTIAELSYREGRASILELLDAYAAYVDAEERRTDLHVTAVRSGLDLERALGPAKK